MIKFINPELFQLDTTLEHGENGDYYKTVVSSVSVANQKTGEKASRVITTIFSDTEDFNDSNAGVKSTQNDKGGVRVSINAFEKNKYDTNIYIAAVPFNGFIEEIEKSFQYRIYRGVMVKSDKRNIVLNGLAYKKIAYMIIVPNENMLSADHKYHVDSLDLRVVSYNLETNESGDHDTVKYTTTLTFSAPGECSVESVSETIDPINPDDFKGKSIFPIFVKDNNTGAKRRPSNGFSNKRGKDNHEKRPNDNNRKNFSNNKRRY